MNNPHERTLTLSTIQKVMGIFLAIAIPILTSVASYVVFKSSTDYRLVESEKRTENHELRIVQIEQTGAERRIMKLETRADNTDKTIGEINSKLDVAVAILQRMETEQRVQAAKKP